MLMKRKSFGTQVVQISVGKNEKEQRFGVHESLLTSRSAFFKRVMNPLYRKTPDSPIPFPYDDPDVFQAYITLLYTESIPTRGKVEWLKLVRLYVLVEKLEDAASKKAIINAMHSFIKEVFPKERPQDFAAAVAEHSFITAESIVELYNRTSTKSQARKLVIDLYADNGREVWLTRGRDVLPKEFLYDLAVAMVRKRPYSLFGSMLDRPSSHYHEAVDITQKREADVPVEKLSRLNLLVTGASER
jgi:hypothetical protein